MKIIKKDGRLQDFDVQKLNRSILLASDDIGQPLNEADIKTLSAKAVGILKNIRGDNPTSAYEVIGVTLSTLKKEGFEATANSYAQGKK